MPNPSHVALPSSARSRSLSRVLLTYALLLAVPVALLGAALAASYRSEAKQRGVAEGRSEALLVAQTAVEPLLDGRPLSEGISNAERADLDRLVSQAVKSDDILRLRLRDLAGNVVFSDDGSGFNEKPEDEALDAADGETVARLTRLNDDPNDKGPPGPASVEVYQPIYAGPSHDRVGVLEMYLPYAPINVDVSADLHTLYRDLALGLGALYLVLLVISVSVTRRLRVQVKANKFLAEHDVLTDLPNRSLFQEHAQAAVDHARRTETSTAVGIVDLDRFKEINDTLGHDSGDQLLTQLAQRLADATRPGDSVARLGGDEFGIVLRDARDAESVLRRLRDLIENEIEVSGLPLSIESSIGFVVAPDDGTDITSLVQHAEVAMYEAKAQHVGVLRYDPAHDHYDAANLSLLASLRGAIDNDELVLHYQPKESIDSGRLCAVEALVRWQHPALGLLYPDRFIPLVEQTDLIDKLTDWVLRTAMQETGELFAGSSDVVISVNVSARSLSRPHFAQRVLEGLEACGASPDRLIVEITETALLTDPRRASTVLTELHRAGVHISIDDFGVGQTSLQYLSSLPIDELKIDKTFVGDMLADQAHAAIVRSIVELGHNLSLSVVAEGVESTEVLDDLRAISCDMAQGFLLARPMPIEKLRTWCHEQPGTRLTVV